MVTLVQEIYAFYLRVDRALELIKHPLYPETSKPGLL